MNKVMNYTEQDKQFYPTPKSFLERIKSDFWMEIKSLGSHIKVLEPSAGKGDIADYLKSWSNSYILTFYKKGTCHIKFRNQDLLDKFNIFASQRKGWLPPSYGKKAYNEMNEEEKKLVKEFSGNEQNYNKIFENQNLYIVESKELLQLQGA